MLFCLNTEEPVLNHLIKMDGLKFIHFPSPLDVKGIPCKVTLKRDLPTSPLSHGVSVFFKQTKLK